jgi:hypothetical protein
MGAFVACGRMGVWSRGLELICGSRLEGVRWEGGVWLGSRAAILWHEYPQRVGGPCDTK